VSEAVHGTSARWHSGCRCTQCRRAHSHTQRAWRQVRAQKRLPSEVRQQLLDGIYAGQLFRTVLRDLNLTSNQVWGLTQTDQEWSAELEAALTATRRDDLKHGTNAAYVAGCVCGECREHQRVRMARNRANGLG
jgi:Zn ribbon nucleic-acid-binding protein